MNALETVLRVFAERMVGDGGRWRELLRDDSEDCSHLNCDPTNTGFVCADCGEFLSRAEMIALVEGNTDG